MRALRTLGLFLVAAALVGVLGVDEGFCTRVAVIDFESIGDDPNIGRGVTEIVRTELIKTGKYEVVERALLNKVLEEQRFQVSDLVDPSKAVELGKILGADLILTGSVVKIGTSYTINGRFIDVKTGAARKAEAIRGNEINELTYMSSQLIEILEKEVKPTAPRPREEPAQQVYVPAPTRPTPTRIRPRTQGYARLSVGVASFAMEELNDLIESFFWGQVDPIESGLNLDFCGMLVAGENFNIGVSVGFLRGVAASEDVFAKPVGGSVPAKTLDIVSEEIKVTGTSVAVRAILRRNVSRNLSVGLGADAGVIALKYLETAEYYGETWEAEGSGPGGLFGVFLNAQLLSGSSFFVGGDFGFRGAKGDVDLDSGGTLELDFSGSYALVTAGLRF